MFVIQFNADPPAICYGERRVPAGVCQIIEDEKEAVTPRQFYSEEEERILNGLIHSLSQGKAVVWEEASLVKRFVGYCYLAIERWAE